MKNRLNKLGLISMILFIILQFSKLGFISFFEKTYGEGRIGFYPKAADKYEVYAFNQIDEDVPKVYIGEGDYKLTGKENQEVKGLAVSYMYPSFEPMNFMEGSFWGAQAEMEGRNVVVISKELAAKVFNTYKVIGRKIEIEKSDYQIIGVYEKPKELIYSFVEDGEERVYFPITSLLGKPLKVNSIWLKDQQVLKQMKLGEGTLYEAMDAAKRLKSIMEVSINLLAIVIVIYFIKKCMDSLFFNSQYTPRTKCKYLILYIGLILGIMKLFIIHIYIPSEVLPPYNIFDLNYYWEYFKAQIIIHQKMMKLSETSFENIYWLLTKWSLEFTVCQFILCFPIIHFIREWIKSIRKERRLFKS